MKTILVVDDEFDILTTLEMVLSMEGYQVVTASDGNEGLKKASEIQPDLILTDIMMPIMNGIEMIKKIRTTPQLMTTPIIVMSAMKLQPEKDQIQQNSWSLYLRKPLDLDKLLNSIRSQVER